MDVTLKDRVAHLAAHFVVKWGAEWLREAIMTDHIQPDDLGEYFISGLMERLGLENDLAQRREDKIQKVLLVLDTIMVFVFQKHAPPVQSTAADRRKLAEAIVDKLGGKT